MTVSDADISNALLISTCDGTYPESEEILKTNLNASALRPSLQLIQKARHRIEVGGLPQLIPGVLLTRVRAGRYPTPQPK